MSPINLLQALERGTTAPLQRAALSLLAGLFGLFDRVDVVDRWYIFTADGRSAFVAWSQLADDADRGAVPMSDGERAVLLLAASLADGYRVDLGSVLPAIDEGHGAALVTAVYGVLRGRDPVTTEWDALRHAGADDRDQDDADDRCPDCRRDMADGHATECRLQLAADRSVARHLTRQRDAAAGAALYGAVDR